jgi:hypothetical protein
MSSSPSEERRPGSDRRRRNLKGSVKGLFLARRRARRRDSDAHVIVDHFRARHLSWAFGIPLLCAIDCFWTLHILAAGGREVNPLMRALIEYDVGWFTAVKMLLTSACVLVLLTYGHFKVLSLVRVSHVMYALLLGYMVLFAYEVHLIKLAYSS